MKPFQILLLLAVLFGSATRAQAQSAHNLVDIAYKGIPVVVDGNLNDWADAHFVFMSQDSPFFLDLNGNQIQGVPLSPDDFSGFFALKMDDEAIYIAVSVRDEGTPMIETPSSPNLAFNYDHISLYLGLYDIGNRPGSPHQEGPGQFYHIANNERRDSVLANRTYRIGPGQDNTTSTLGPDYQLLLRALAHNPATFDSRMHTYSGAYMDTTIGGTLAAGRLFPQENGYTLEWRIPFTSLSGNVGKGTGPYSGKFNWPLYAPAHGHIIPFDVDLTDLDDGDRGNNRYLRAGQNVSLWRDSKGFGMRGRVVDLSQHAYDRPNSKYYIDYKPVQNITIDGNWDDWNDAMFVGKSQDHPHFLDVNGNPIQGVPLGASDFSYYFAMKMDDENLYAFARVRDDGTPMVETPDAPNLAFNYDHLSMYLGLYNIGTRPGSPHQEGPGQFIHIANNERRDSVVANRTYRIGPGQDNTTSTLGPDYQLIIRALPHNPATFESRLHTYSGAYMDTTIGGTVAAGKLDAEEAGYFLEWKIPLASLAGNVAKGTGPYSGKFNWPLYQPANGHVIAFDADMTDLDAGDRGNNRFMRLGRMPSLWRDSKSFGMRGNVISGGIPLISTSIERDDLVGRDTDRPGSIYLEANYPNPFNPTTTITYGMGTTGRVNLTVYDMLGRPVAVLVNDVRAAGEYRVSFDASGLASGLYIYRLTNGSESVTRTMTLVK